MDTSVLDLALRASVNPAISTKAIRLLGLHGEIARKMAVANKDGPRTEAFLDREDTEHFTGMCHRTVDTRAADEHAEQIGLIIRCSDGVQNELMQGTRHGIATGWYLGTPKEFPALLHPPVLSRDDAETLDPANTFWSRNDRGYRLALVLVAHYGVGEYDLTTAQVAGLLQTSLPNAVKALDALCTAVIGAKVGRGKWRVFLDRSAGLGDVRIDPTAHAKFVADRQEWIAYKTKAKAPAQSEVA